MAKSQYNSGQSPQSSILKSTFLNRLSSLFGYRIAADGHQAANDIERKYGLQFVKVDLNNPNFRVKSAALGSFFESAKLSKSLEKYFDEYLKETSLSYSDIAERQQRLNELSYMSYNDPIISRCIDLVADEATQIDSQNRILSVESPNLSFVQKCYELFGIWGITADRIRGACYDIELYGEAFWSHKITLGGVQNIKPIEVNTIIERLEFSPSKMANFLAQRDGYLKANKNRDAKLQTLIDTLKNGNALDYSENLSDFFDTKLLGYELEDGNIIPPWLITHFRFNADHSEFYPYGRPHLIHALAPFKQLSSTIALQGLARQMSFPVTLYKVKTTEGITPGKALELVNDVREEYDNIGLTPATAGNEVYTVNTKIWIADGLMDIDIKESKVDIDFVGDIEIYQDRIMMVTGIPKGYLDQEYGGFGQSGIALVEQYKPFARHIYSVQSTFLQGLGELIRLHFAITGEYDYNTPFILSMRFPAQEMGDEQREARMASIELTQTVIELLTSVLGIEEGEPLPEDVVIDILSKYTFLDATDIQKWMRLSSFLKPANVEANEDADDVDGGFDGGGGGGGISGGGGDGFDEGEGGEGEGEGEENGGGGEDIEEVQESKISKYKKFKLLRERKKYLRKLKEERLREVSKKYKIVKNELPFKLYESVGMTEFIKKDALGNSPSGKHSLLIPPIRENSVSYTPFQIIAKDNDPNLESGMRKLAEKTIDEMMEEKRQETYENPLADYINREIKGNIKKRYERKI